MKRPAPATAISIAALVVALGGTSYAAAGQIQKEDIARNAVTSGKIAAGAVGSSEIKDGSVRAQDLSSGAQQAGPQGPAGPAGADGADGADGTSRWALVETDNSVTPNVTTIVDSSGGFTLVAAYPTLANTATPPAADNSLRANGNVYINAGEDLSDNGVLATIALQNTRDLNGDAITSGRAPGADSNPEFSGEISTSLCNVGAPTTPPSGPTNCAPAGAQNAMSFVVSPRNSDGSFTTDNNRKRFYVVLTGDSSDYTPAP